VQYISKEQLAIRWGISMQALDQRRRRQKSHPQPVSYGRLPGQESGPIVALFDLEHVREFEELYAMAHGRSLIGAAA
jgi:hypothetical protein